MPDALPLDLAPPPRTAPPASYVSLGMALRHALRDGAGRVVLRVEEAAPHRRRVARALLQEGALAAGGQVLDGPDGDLLLVGAEIRRTERLLGLLERLVGPAATLTWSLERDAEALLAYAEGRGAAAPLPAPAGPKLAALDAFLDALPLEQMLHRMQAAPPGGALSFLRIEPSRPAIAASLGPLGRDADLLDHATSRLTARLLSALAEPAGLRALLGTARAPRLHLPLTIGTATGRHAPGSLVATLPLSTAAEPDLLAARQAALAEAGIGLELDGLDAATVALLELAALPPVHLRLRWSPSLAGVACRGIAALDPARLALAGPITAEALDFAATLGIAVEQPA